MKKQLTPSILSGLGAPSGALLDEMSVPDARPTVDGITDGIRSPQTEGKSRADASNGSPPSGGLRLTSLGNSQRALVVAIASAPTAAPEAMQQASHAQPAVRVPAAMPERPATDELQLQDAGVVDDGVSCIRCA
jgi:hypothetical protein